MAREPEAIAELRRSLGAQLIAFRLAAELTQGQLAKVAICDRTMIAHIEKGRGRGDERFWRAVDGACDAGGALLTAYLELKKAPRPNTSSVSENNASPASEPRQLNCEGGLVSQAARRRLPALAAGSMPTFRYWTAYVARSLAISRSHLP